MKKSYLIYPRRLEAIIHYISKQDMLEIGKQKSFILSEDTMKDWFPDLIEQGKKRLYEEGPVIEKHEYVFYVYTESWTNYRVAVMHVLYKKDGGMSLAELIRWQNLKRSKNGGPLLSRQSNENSR